MITGTQTIILNEKNQILVAKRSCIKKLAANKWNLIGGKVEEFDKSIYVSAIREIKEEVNLNIRESDLELVQHKIANWEDIKFNCYTFLTRVKNPKVKLNPEHSDCEFINIEDLDNYDFVGFTKEELKQLINGLI